MGGGETEKDLCPRQRERGVMETEGEGGARQRERGGEREGGGGAQIFASQEKIINLCPILTL